MGKAELAAAGEAGSTREGIRGQEEMPAKPSTPIAPQSSGQAATTLRTSNAQRIEAVALPVVPLVSSGAAKPLLPAPAQ